MSWAVEVLKKLSEVHPEIVEKTLLFIDSTFSANI